MRNQTFPNVSRENRYSIPIPAVLILDLIIDFTIEQNDRSESHRTKRYRVSYPYQGLSDRDVIDYKPKSANFLAAWIRAADFVISAFSRRSIVSLTVGSGLGAILVLACFSLVIFA